MAFLPCFTLNSRILILGSFPSVMSRAQNFYYGNPRNRFWFTLAKIFGEDTPSSIEDKKSFLSRHGIALWDVIAECEIIGASDAHIRSAVPNDFGIIFSACRVREVFTVGKLAEKLYEKFTGRSAVCLPSPSPANRAVSDERLLAEYARIADALREDE